VPELGWIDRIGPYRVQKKEGPRPDGQAYLRLKRQQALIVHTTEGSSVDGAVFTLRSRFSAPHFVVGEGRIVQMRPLWAEAATVRTWNDRYIQVECVGHASLKLHRLTEGTWKPLVALARFVHEELGIPLRRPNGWSDQLAGGTWANNNPRRQSRIALEFHGLVGHIEIPDQDPTWHWDPGSLDYSALIAEAKAGTKDTEDDVMYLKFKEGVRKYVRRTKEKGHDAGPAPKAIEDHDVRWGWGLARSLSDKGRDLGAVDPDA
jgi:hypothetical protein